VCCLVGLGGGGKTATVDHFLRRLDVLPMVALARGPDLLAPRPRAALVFSLAEASPDAFFDELSLWAHGEALPPSSASYDLLRRQLAALGQEAAEPILIVLDGVEAAQTTGGADGLGRLLDHRIRDLLVRIAYGALPGICLLATTRLAPVDIEVQRLSAYTKIELEAMDAEAAVALLRARGVRESDRELRRIGEAYGHHALTLDLVGSYIHDLGVPPPSLPAAASGGNASGATARRVPTALEDVVASYLAAVVSGERSATASPLLEILSIFHRGASAGLLGDLLRRGGSPGTLDPEIQAELTRLGNLRIVRRTALPGQPASYSLHEVIRDFVYEQIPALRRRDWHSATAARLEPAAERTVGLGGGADVQALDLLEEIIYHQVRSPDPMAGFHTYWNRVGNYRALGHRTCDFARGERLCRILNADQPPDCAAGYLQRAGADAALLGDWGLYLLDLGDTPRARRAFLASYHCALVRQDLSNLPIAARNVSESHLWSGETGPALHWTERGMQHGSQLLERLEGIPTAEVMRAFDENLQLAATALLLAGQVDRAQDQLEQFVSLHRQARSAHRAMARLSPVDPAVADLDVSFESLAEGRPWGRYLLLRGAPENACLLVESQLEVDRRQAREDGTSIELREIAARALLALGQADVAAPHIDAIERWASARDSAPQLCVALILRASLALDRGESEAAHELATEGLRIARESGLGLLHVELLTLIAEAALRLGDPEESLHAASTALFGQVALEAGVALYQAPAREDEAPDHEVAADEWAGIFPPAETGRPPLFAATHPSCRYRWGEAAARRIRAEALLYRLALDSGRATAAGEVTPEGQARIEKARGELASALRILEPLVFEERREQDPRLVELRSRLQDLDQGILTRIALESGWMPPADAASVSPREESDHRPPLRLLISYSHRDVELANRVAADLEQVFEDVWIDRRRVHVGESFVSAINQALAHVTDFILILSRSASRSAWVKNELNAAIALRNQGRFLRIRPVAIDDAEIPPLLADLDVLRLEPGDHRTGIARLIDAIRPVPRGSTSPH
jgi:tetratricopeptide (TPR) repeat protein